VQTNGEYNISESLTEDVNDVISGLQLSTLVY